MDLKFAPFISEIELPFHHAFAEWKMNIGGLDDSARSILGLYEPRFSKAPEESCRMQVLGNALTSNA